MSYLDSVYLRLCVCLCAIKFLLMDLTNETKINKKKKKRVRKNKKWIPYKELTPEERTLLRQERNRKHLREHLLRTRMAVNTASNSGDYSFLMNAPNVTNEVSFFLQIISVGLRVHRYSCKESSEMGCDEQLGRG